jgi:hypothetical protein
VRRRPERSFSQGLTATRSLPLIWPPLLSCTPTCTQHLSFYLSLHFLPDCYTLDTTWRRCGTRGRPLDVITLEKSGCLHPRADANLAPSLVPPLPPPPLPISWSGLSFITGLNVHFSSPTAYLIIRLLFTFDYFLRLDAGGCRRDGTFLLCAAPRQPWRWQLGKLVLRHGNFYPDTGFAFSEGRFAVALPGKPRVPLY